MIFKMLKTALMSVRMHRGETEGAMQDPTVLKKPDKNVAQVQGRGAFLPSFVPREQCKKNLKPEFGLWET